MRGDKNEMFNYRLGPDEHFLEVLHHQWPMREAEAMAWAYRVEEAQAWRERLQKILHESPPLLIRN